MQWNIPDPLVQQQNVRESHGRMMLAARGPAVTLTEGELIYLPDMPADAAGRVRSLTLWGASDWALAHLGKFAQLEELKLVGGRFSAEKLQAVRAALPRCWIIGGEPPAPTPAPAPPAAKPWWKFW